MTEGADLHLHSTASDGRCSPEEQVRRAAEAGLEAIALTDHDTVGGLAAAARAARGHGLELIPGCELSARWDRLDLHVLGLFIDPAHPGIERHARALRRARSRRLERMLERLAAVGVPVDPLAVEAQSAGAPPGRPHLARALVAAGVCGSEDEAFRRFLRQGRPGFVPRETPSLAAVTATVHAAGGLAVLAHPRSSGVGARLLARLVRCGLDGLEVGHPEHGPACERRLRRITHERGLLETAGSDDHGHPDRPRLGDRRLAGAALEALRSAARRRRVA